MADRPKHHTKDPARRAADIADREAEKVYRESGDCSLYFPTWVGVYEAALKEFGWSEKAESLI